jgi:hypothetical protein
MGAVMTEDKPPELQREGCQCELDYACGGDCCGMMYYTCAMHKALGMHASDIYEAWMNEDA